MTNEIAAIMVQAVIWCAPSFDRVKIVADLHKPVWPVERVVGGWCTRAPPAAGTPCKGDDKEYALQY